MGILDLPSGLLSAEPGDAELDMPSIDLGWYEDGPDQLNIDGRRDQGRRSGRQRRSQQPTTLNKGYRLHEWKRGKGVRQQRRYDQFCLVMALLGELSLEDVVADDWYDTGMSIWGQLSEDAAKMKAWNDFIGMTEEKQTALLNSHNSSKPHTRCNKQTTVVELKTSTRQHRGDATEL